MPRSLLSLMVVFAFAASTARAGDDAKSGHGHGKGHGTPPKYEVIGHDDSGNKFVKTFDLADKKQAEDLLHMLTEGHAHEVVNKSAPTVSEMASLRFDLGVWTLVIFGVLMVLLSRLAWPKMIAGLQRREQNIRGALEEAEKARSEAQSLMAELDRERKEAAAKVKAMIDEAKRDAAATAEQIKADNMAQIAIERERLRREIQVETDQALKMLWTKAADLAIQASSAALRKQLDVNQHRRLIDEALADIRKASV
jgi:F-type H+-transporting ATPase subunit b